MVRLDRRARCDGKLSSRGQQLYRETGGLRKILQRHEGDRDVLAVAQPASGESVEAEKPPGLGRH